jgi:hypothetical protein
MPTQSRGHGGRVAMTRFVLLLLLVSVVGCSSSSPSAGEPKQLQGNRIPKGAGPAAKKTP